MIPQFNDARDWFFDKRLGMFLHWGLYSIAGWHEQHQMRGNIPREQYVKQIKEFNPVHFDAKQWLDMIQEAGMEYLCFTTKHHDGFCLWDSKHTDFTVMHSPYGKDVLAMLADECHKRSFPLCLYYSVVDWHHPNYPNKGQSHELDGPEPGDEPDLDRYLDFLREQVRELCTHYGTIHGFWWDMNQTGRTDPSINDMIHQLQPQAVINNRGLDEGDFGTPERDWDKSVEDDLAFAKPTEGCNSVGSDSWGYRREEDYFTARYLIGQADTLLAKGGNFLLNIGPHADGTFPDEALSLARQVGQWYQRNKEAFSQTEPASLLTENRQVLITRQGNTLYVHLNQLPNCTRVMLKPINILPTRAVILNDNQPVASSNAYTPAMYWDQQHYLYLRNLPVDDYHNSVMVIKLEFDRDPGVIL